MSSQRSVNQKLEEIVIELREVAEELIEYCDGGYTGTQLRHIALEVEVVIANRKR